MRKRLIGVVFGFSLAGAACGDPSGPAQNPPDALNGTYEGSTAEFTIRFTARYGVLPGALEACEKLESISRALCLTFPENLQGTGSLTIRSTGEVQQFSFTGLQSINVILSFTPASGIMADVRLTGPISADGASLAATMYKKNENVASPVFGDVIVPFARIP